MVDSDNGASAGPEAAVWIIESAAAITDNIVLDIDGLSSSGGPYNFVIYVEDDYGNTNSDSVWVTVILVSPVSTSTADDTSGIYTPEPSLIVEPTMDMIVVGGLTGAVAIIGILGFLIYSNKIALPNRTGQPHEPSTSGGVVVSSKSTLASKQTQTTKKSLDIGKICPFCGSKNLPDEDKCSVCDVRF
ncbi:MAG: hypothetical protein ACTSSE_06885 [Candidatus Thorarchaeota archaeon]